MTTQRMNNWKFYFLPLLEANKPLMARCVLLEFFAFCDVYYKQP